MGIITTNEEMIFLNSSFKDRQEAIAFMADRLFEGGYVKDTYKERILKREEDYPTGLKGQYCNFALTHTECEYVKKPAYAVAILKDAVDFEHMEIEEGLLPVDVIFMLALDSHDGHLLFLQKLAEFMQKKELVERLLSSESRKETAELLTSKFIKE